LTMSPHAAPGLLAAFVVKRLAMSPRTASARGARGLRCAVVIVRSVVPGRSRMRRWPPTPVAWVALLDRRPLHLLTRRPQVVPTLGHLPFVLLRRKILGRHRCVMGVRRCLSRSCQEDIPLAGRRSLMSPCHARLSCRPRTDWLPLP